MITGVFHVGYGVRDDERSIDFYKKYLAFAEVRISIEDDSFGGFGDFVGRGERYRWSMLTHTTGAVDFEPVQLLSRKPVPIPEDFRWGDVGINEVCFRAQGIQGLYDRFKQEGLPLLAPPRRIRLTGGWEKEFFYLQDPDGIRIKLEQDLRDASKDPTIKDFSYLCVGVSDMEASLRFYREVLGYRETIWEADGRLEWMDDLEGDTVYGRSVMLGSDLHDYLYQLVERRGRKRRLFEGKRWGDIGPLELCFTVEDLQSFCHDLRAQGVDILVEPQQASPELDYAYIAYAGDPDGNYVEFFQNIKK